jgi:purine-cytosine permease-like protein
MSFGQKGSLLFSSLNVLQLIGWTAIMIVSGAAAASSAANIGGNAVWAVVIGALIIVWVLVGIKNLGKLNIAAMSALFILTVIMCAVIFRGGGGIVITGKISFGGAVELSAAMPLSWLPLISDYTRTARKKRAATITSVAVYTVVSCWMYIIGMGASLFTGESDISKIMLTAALSKSAEILLAVISDIRAMTKNQR